MMGGLTPPVTLEVPVPALPVCVLTPLWEQFSALLPDHPLVVPTHPLGCHRRRIPDRVVFEHVVAALVHGSGYERIASPGCSDRTIRRRVQAWAAAGLAQQLHTLVLSQYDRMIGLDLAHLAIDGCITKAPGGGEVAGRSPVDRGKLGLKRSTATEATGIPLHMVATGANRPDAEVLPATLAGALSWRDPMTVSTVHLDAAYDSRATRTLLEGLELEGVIARKGVPAPIQTGPRWVVERTQAWMNGFGRLRRSLDRRREAVEFYLFLAAACVVTRRLIQQARRRYRWPDRPTARRLR